MKRIATLIVLSISFFVGTVYAADAPVTTVSNVETYATSAVVQLTVVNFINVNGCDLRLTYDPAVATAVNVTQESGTGGWFIPNFGTPGVIDISWVNFSASQTLPDGSLFATITFNKVAEGYTDLTFEFSSPVNNDWYFYPPSTVLNDVPESDFYIHGSLAFLSNTSWTGNSDNDWSNSLNWTNGVPGQFTDVTISNVSPNPFPSTTLSGQCYNLVINANSSVTIPEGSALTVYHNITNDGQLLVKSSASGDGSLINYGTISGTGSYQAERYLQDNQWHYVASPVSNALSGVFQDIFLKSFNEPTYSWNSYIVPTNVPLEVMKGYAAWANLPSTLLFDGNLNSGTQSINVSYTFPNGGTYAGYNLVGNPYPSAVDWDIADGWNKNNVDNTIYFWNGDANNGLGNYYYYNGGGGEVPGVGLGFTGTTSSIIPAMQGFFVRATANGVFEVNDKARVHNNQPFYKKQTENTLPLVRLKVEDSWDNIDETVVRFYPEASEEYDGDYDAFKLDGYMIPQIFTITPDEDWLAINTAPTWEVEPGIPLGFTTVEAGEFTISLTQFENFEPGLNVYIHDLNNDQLFNLTENLEYAFTAQPGDPAHRFDLVFGYKLGVDDVVENSVNIYSVDGVIKVFNPAMKHGSVAVYDLTGRLVAEAVVDGSKLTEIPISQKTGYYLVRLNSDISTFVEKVFVR